MSNKPTTDHTHENLPPESGESRAATRRHLLKGAALSAPAVFTLPSTASAFALGSVTQCVRHQTAKPDHLHVAKQDKWARKRVPAIVVEACSDQPQRYTFGTRDTHVLVGYDDEMFVDSRNRRWSRDNEGYYIDPWGKSFQEVNEHAERYTVAWIRDDGTLLGIDPRNRHHGRAITGSCWVSLLPRA